MAESVTNYWEKTSSVASDAIPQRGDSQGVIRIAGQPAFDRNAIPNSM